MKPGADETKLSVLSAGKVWFLALVAALGGFLFGFDTIVINGAEQDIQRIWNLSGAMHGWVVSSALWGTVVGALGGGWIADRCGRKPTLCVVGILYFVSAFWSALATGPMSLMIARLIGGFGVGISTIAAPVYIAEISPAASRGRLTALFQFNIVTGIVAALASNLFLRDFGANAWRWMLAAACIFVFLASHGLGQGTVIWVLISEVFPQRFRARGQALGASTHWVFAALVALIFPIAAESVPAWAIFAFFGIMMVFHLLWAWFVVPETKGRSLLI